MRRFSTPHLGWPAAALLVALCTIADAQKHAYESTGYKATAIPIVNFSSDDGTGYGARVNIFDYDGKHAPYRRAYSAQAFLTTGGKWVHRLQFDAPTWRPAAGATAMAGPAATRPASSGPEPWSA